MAGNNTFVWKPKSEKNGKLAVLLPSNVRGNQQLAVVDAQGNVLEIGRYDGRTNGGRPTYRFNTEGGKFPAGSKVVTALSDGSSLVYDIGSTAEAIRGLQPSQESTATITQQAIGSGGGAFSGEAVSIDEDVTLQVPQARFGSFNIPELPQITLPDVDQRQVAGQIGEFNLQAQQDAFGLAKGQTKELLDLELEGLTDFIQRAQQLRQEGAITENQFNQMQISAANEFNQLQRLGAVDIAMPEARDFISEGITRNRQLAQGVIPDTLQDRQFELTSRSIAADAITAGGFGAGSMAGQKVSDLMSARERLGLSQAGEAGGQRFLQLGMQLNFDQPIKYSPILSTTTEAITGQPSVSIAGLGQQQAGALTGLTAISPERAIDREVRRGEIQAQLDRERDRINLQNYVDEQTFLLNADLFNEQQMANMINLSNQMDDALEQAQKGQSAAEKSAIFGAVGDITGEAMPIIAKATGVL